MLLLALAEVVGALHLNGEAQIADAARHVCFNEDVARVDVAVSHRQLLLI